MARGSAVSLPSEIHYGLRSGIYIVEVHFDLNPIAAMDVSTIDVSGSGLRAYYSSEPRSRALGVFIMEIGEFSIPPGRREYTFSFAMHFLPEQGIDTI